MSKRIYIPALIIIFFTALIFLGPKLLDVDTVRSKVAAVMSAKSGWHIDAAQLDWYWLPSPHFSLKNTVISKNGVLLTLPETRIFPLWRSVLFNKLELKELKLIRPELRIDALTINNKGPTGINLPQARITVLDGSMVVAEDLFAGLAHLPPLTISEINATIDLSPERGEFQLSIKSPYFNFMELEGAFTPADLGYKLDYEINGLQFYQLLPALANKRLLPVESAISLQGNIVGTGTEQLEASLTGDFPCFVAPAATESFLLDCGSADLNISKDADGFTININELQLKNPGLILSGKIAKLIDKNATANAPPVWLVDLTGKDLDLTAIRQGVLTLWGDNHIARTVCDIVLGGKARQATYFFKAPLAGFRSIQQMKIKVDIEEAEIHPPHTPLFLDKASGQIEIIDGYLTGQGLTTRLGDSRGENCSLFLDLANRKKDFRLSLDIDADLIALPDILHELVPHDGFQRELLRFSNIQGRAQAHLTIGETLAKPKVTVNISSINGGAKYEPMENAFRIRSGSLDIYSDNLEWRGIKGILGPHVIRDSAGKVSWNEGVLLEIKAAKATFDAAALLNELSTASVLPSGIGKAITKAEGIVELNKATMIGLINEPDNWQYSLDIATSGSRWTSPMLPHSILAERVRGRISRNKIELVSGKIWFLEQPLLIEGSFSHNKFTDWRFWTRLSGTIREPLAEWIREKEWIPNSYFPVIPCTLDKLKVQWDSDSFRLSGGIAAGMGGITSPSVRLQLESNQDHLKIHELVVSSPEEQGHLTLDYLKKDPDRLHLSWQGFINSTTILKLLNENILQAERLEGDFSVKHTAGFGGTKFTGWAKAQNVDWLFNKNRPNFMIKDLKITGDHEGSVKINQAVIVAEDEELNLNGQISMASDKLTFDLELNAEKISSLAVKQIVNDIKMVPAADEMNSDSFGSSPGKQLQGVLRFKTALYTSSNPKESQDETTASSSYVLSPAQGFITVDSATDLYSIDLRNSNICGLNISGTFQTDKSHHESALNVFTDSSSPPLFKDVLPCLGLENTLIDGAMQLDVNLKGMANEWQSGSAELYSDKGYIYRLSFLSKIFRLINLRDIFSGTELPDFANEGFAYSRVDIVSHIEDNKLHIDKAFIDGEGLNVFGLGQIDLTDWTADLTIMLAPLKTVDAIISNIPLVGKVVAGKDKALVSIPVSLKGKLRDPKVTVLPPEAIGKGFLNLIANTLMMPFQIITPLLSNDRQ